MVGRSRRLLLLEQVLVVHWVSQELGGREGVTLSARE